MKILEKEKVLDLSIHIDEEDVEDDIVEYMESRLTEEELKMPMRIETTISSSQAVINTVKIIHKVRMLKSVKKILNQENRNETKYSYRHTSNKR